MRLACCEKDKVDGCLKKVVWWFGVVVGGKVVRSEFADLDEMKCQTGKRWVKERARSSRIRRKLK